MRLTCQHIRLLRIHAILFLTIAAVACTDPSEPPSISARFALTDINGQQLPYRPPPTGGTQTPTIVSGSLTLYNSGVAVLEENQTTSAGGTTLATSRFTYRITGSQIEFSPETPCPIDAICVAPPTGELLDNGIHAQVVWPPLPTTVIYRYQILATL